MDPLTREHVRAQAWRFARISALALLAQLLAAGWVWPGWAGLWALVPGALEAGLRQVYPTKRLPDRIVSMLDPAAGPGPGLPTIPPGVVESTPRAAPGTGVPMERIDVPRNPDGTFGPATISSEPPKPGG